VDTLTHRDGWLCILSESSQYNQPVLTRAWYPILECTPGRAEQDFGPLGRQAKYDGDGRYSVPPDHRTYILTEGGRTKPIAFETLPIPCPKVRKGTEMGYKSGAWRKYLKTQGWVLA